MFALYNDMAYAELTDLKWMHWIYRIIMCGRVPMQSAFSKRLLRHKQRLHRRLEHRKWCWIESTYAKPICILWRIPMLSANEQHCKRRLKTAHWAGTFGAIIFWMMSLKSLVLDDRDVELRIWVSVSMPGKNFRLKSSFFLHTAGDNSSFVKDGVSRG